MRIILNGVNYIVISLMIYNAHPKFDVDKNEKNEIFGACKCMGEGSVLNIV